MSIREKPNLPKPPLSQKSEIESALQRAARKIPGVFTETPNPPTSQEPLANAPSLQKSLLQDRVLQDKISQTQWASLLDSRLFAHITSDVFIHGSNLSGDSIQRTARYASLFLPFLQDEKHLFDPSQLSQFQGHLADLTMEQPAEELAKNVAWLKAGERFLMSGGWRSQNGSPGHEMIYEFYRRADGNYDMSVYNTGGGVEYHPTLFSGIKAKIQRVLKYENILPAELGLSKDSTTPYHSDFFEALIRCQRNKFEPHKMTKAEHIYEGVLGHLAPKIKSAGNNASFFSISQRGGTCTEYVLKPLAYKLLCKEDTQLFKRQHFYKRFYATIAFFQRQEKKLDRDEEDGSEARLLLKNSATKLLRTAAKFYNPQNMEKSLLSQEEAETIQATLCDVQKRVETAEAVIQTKRHLATQSTSFEVDNGRELAKDLVNKKPPVPSQSVRANLLVDAPKPLHLPTGETLCDDLALLLKRVEEISEGDPRIALSEMQQLFEALPSNPSVLCKDVPEAQVKKSIDQLYLLLQAFASLCGRHANYTPAYENVMLSMLAHIHELALRQDAKVFGKSAALKEFALSITLNNNVTLDPFLVFYDPCAFQRRMELLAYFEKPTDCVKKDSFLGLFVIELDPSRPSIQDREAEYLLSLIRTDPALLEKHQKRLQEAYRKNRDLANFPDELVQKAVALGTIELGTSSFCASLNLGHVFTLRHAAFLCKQFAVDSHRLSKMGRLTTRMRGESETLSLSFDDGDSLNWKRDASSMHYRQNGLDIRNLARTNMFNRSHDLATHLTESDAYYDRSDDKIATSLETTNCKSSLQPAKVLYYFMHHLADFDDPKKDANMQTLFDLFFFKPHAQEKNKGAVSLFEELAANPSLQKQCNDFIDQGIDYFYQKQPAMRPKVEKCLFFIRLGIRLKKICPELKTKNLLAEMDEWLGHPALTESEKSQIHLHKILYYQTLGLDRLNAEEIGHYLGHFFVYNQQPIEGAFHNPHLDQEVRSALYSHSTQLQERLAKNPSEKEAICNRILSICNLPRKGSSWEGSYPVFKQKSSNSSWQMNMLTGQLVGETGPVSTKVDPQIYKESAYKELFGEERFIMQQEGNVFFFQHPQYGEVRIDFSINRRHPYEFFRVIEGSLFRYIPSSGLTLNDKTDLPIALVDNHTHWLSKDVMHIYPKDKPFDLVATVKEGAITLQNGDHLMPVVKLGSGWKKFASSAMYVPLSIDQGKNLHKIEIPYYRSALEKPLQFNYVKEKFYWEENPKFFVSEKQPKNLYFPNFLLLENESGTEKKFLVPLKKIDERTAIAPQIALQMANDETTVLEYDLQKEKLIPKQMEGTLFYAYLLAAQKKHREALELLQSIPQAMPLSQKSMQILEWITKLPKHSPACTTVQLSAANQLSAREKGSSLTMKDIDQIVNGQNNVPFDLRAPMPSLSDLYFSQERPKPSQHLLDQPTLGSFPYLSEWSMERIEKNLSVDKDKGEFARLYHLARSAKTEEEKIQVQAIYRYHQINDYTADFQKAMIHFAFLHPELAPDLPSRSFTQTWILDAKNLYNKACERPPKAVSRAPSQTPKSDPITGAFVNTLPMARMASQASFDATLEKSYETQPLALSSLAEDAFSFVAKGQKIDYKSENLTEENYTDAILAELGEFQHDYEVGSLRASQKKTWVLQEDKAANLQKLNTTLEVKIAMGTKSLQITQARINALIHKKAPSASLQLKDALLEQGEAITPIKLQELITMFGREDKQGFAKANPYLTGVEIAELHQKVFEYLLFETDIAQAKRAKTFVEKLLDPKTSNRAVLENTLAQTLQAKIAYTPDVEKTMLVFEHRAGMRLRPNQVALIHKMLEMDPSTKKYRNVVAQLMMGGGKTTVIASILLELAAKPGRIPLYIAPTAQFETLRSNLSMAQLKYFDRQVIAVDLTREQLEQKKLQELNQKLHQATKDGSVVLIRAETLQMLQLELLSLLRAQKTTRQAGLPVSSEVIEKIKSLHNSLALLAERGDAIIDEVDVVLAPPKVVNFPTSDFELIASNWVELMQTIVELHISDSLKINGSSVNSLLKLRENRESAIDLNLYQNTICPLLVKELFLQKHESWKMKKEMQESFVRYVLGKMKKGQLTQDDQAFLTFFQSLGHSKDIQEKEIADEIALSKQYFQAILPAILPKEVNRHMGRVRAQLQGAKKQKGRVPGEVVPYVGVDSPSPAKFGNPFEAGFYQFLTALRVGISEEQIAYIATWMDEAVQHASQKENLPYDKTPEAQEFLELAGVPLHRIFEPGNLQKASQYVNANVDRMLKFEAETVSAIVGSYRYFFSSNAQNLEAQLSTKRALSGTPFNYCSYSQSLKNNLALDTGVEGEITHALIERNCPIRSFKGANIREILSNALKQGTPRDRLRGYTDAAGVLKNSDNFTVAKEILSFYENDPSIDTVLFFGRKTKDEAAPNHLYALRKNNQGRTEFIGTTNHQALFDRGIDPAKTFIYFDENHCEATDLPQKPDAINLVSLSDTLIRRTFFQAALRLRQFFEGQTIECTLADAARESFPNKAQSIQDVFPVLSKNLAIYKAKENYRSYQHKMEHVSRQTGIDALLKAKTMYEIIKAYEMHEQEFLIDQTIHPFEQFGGLEELLDTRAVLKNKASQKKTSPAELRLLRVFQTLHPNLRSLLEEASLDSYLPKQVLQIGHNLGQTVEVQQQVQIAQNTEVETQLEQELALELQRYSYLRGNDKYVEKVWKDEGSVILPKITAVGTVSESPQVHPLQELLSCLDYQKPYHEIFDSNILITNNLALSRAELMPVFHRGQKPAHQILVLNEPKGMRFVLLSIHDADHFKKLLAKYKPNDIWLLLPDGQEYSSHSHSSLDAARQKVLARALLQVNLFNGDASYLSFREKEAKAFFEEKNGDLKQRFLALKVEKDKQQRRIYYRSRVLSGKAQSQEKAIQTLARTKFSRASRM